MLTGVNTAYIVVSPKLRLLARWCLPLSRVLYRINRHTGTPVNAVWLSALLACLLGLISFAGSAAIGAVFTLTVIAQYISNSIPITARVLGGQPFTPGPFNLGRFVSLSSSFDVLELIDMPRRVSPSQSSRFRGWFSWRSCCSSPRRRRWNRPR